MEGKMAKYKGKTDYNEEIAKHRDYRNVNCDKIPSDTKALFTLHIGSIARPGLHSSHCTCSGLYIASSPYIGSPSISDASNIISLLTRSCFRTSSRNTSFRLFSSDTSISKSKHRNDLKNSDDSPICLLIKLAETQRQVY